MTNARYTGSRPELSPTMFAALTYLLYDATGAPLPDDVPVGVHANTLKALIGRGLVISRDRWTWFRPGIHRHHIARNGTAHVLTADGLRMLSYQPDTNVRELAAQQAVRDAAHAYALATGIDHDDAVSELMTDYRRNAAAARLVAEKTIFSTGRSQRELTPARPVLCRQSSIPASRHEPEANEFCDLSIDHEGNHSWAPKDLAPSSLRVQREALAADQAHAKRASKVRDDQAAGSVTPAADPGWVADRDEAGRMTSEEADAYYGATETTAPLEHERSLVEVRAELNEPTPHQQYGADERWTHLDGAKFRLGPDTDPVVTAHAVRDMPGEFMLHILGHVFGPVARGEDGMWHEVRGR